MCQNGYWKTRGTPKRRGGFQTFRCLSIRPPGFSPRHRVAPTPVRAAHGDAVSRLPGSLRCGLSPNAKPRSGERGLALVEAGDRELLSSGKR